MDHMDLMALTKTRVPSLFMAMVSERRTRARIWESAVGLRGAVRSGRTRAIEFEAR